MTGSSTQSIDHSDPPLLALLKKQVSLFEQLAGLSEQQTGLIGAGPSEALLTLLASRQRCIDALAAVGNQLKPFRAKWPEARQHLNEQQESAADRLIERAQMLLDAILKQDDRDRCALQRLQQQIGGELTRVQHGGRANRAYQTGGASQASRYTDRRG